MLVKIQKLKRKIKKNLCQLNQSCITTIHLDKEVQPISSVFGCDRGTPIDRYYIEKFLAENKSKIKGVCCEIAEDAYCSGLGHNIIKQEVFDYDNANPLATIIGDLTKHESLPTNHLDCFVCTQTFNFIYDVKSAFVGAYQMLKSNGVLLATVSGLSQISRYDMDRWGDYWRFTDLSLKKLAEETGFNNITVKAYGNALAATAFIQGVAVEDLSNVKLLDVLDKDYQITLGLIAVK
jgi:hypothetical protein